MIGQKKLSRDEQAQAIQSIAKMLPKPEGRKKLAALMTKMINQTPDVKSIGREALAFAPVENSSQAVLTNDAQVKAFVCSDAANYGVDIYTSRKVLVPQVHLTANLDMTYVDIKDCTYDLPTRVKELIKFEIIAKEDQMIFSIFSKVCANNDFNPTIVVPKVDFNIETVIDASSAIEGNDLEAKSIFIHPSNAGVFKKSGFDYLDDATKREYMQTGVVGIVNGLKIFKSRFVPLNTVYITAAKEQTGVCFELMPLTINPADNPRQQTIGFVGAQHAGYAVANERAIQEIKLV